MIEEYIYNIALKSSIFTQTYLADEPLSEIVKKISVMPSVRSSVTYAIIMTISLLTCLIVHISLKKLYKIKYQSNFLIRTLLPALRKPLITIILIESAIFGIHYVHKNYDLFWLHIGDIKLEKLSDISITANIAWFMVAAVARIERDIIAQRERKKLSVNYTDIGSISLLIKITIGTFSLLQIVSHLGFKLQTLLTFGGLGSVIIGFAGKDMLANFFGVIMVYLDRPFTIGDEIIIPSLTIQGKVEKITWRLTVIRQFNKIPVYLPNSVFNTTAVENLSRMTHRRINESIKVYHQDYQQVSAITADIKRLLHDDNGIDNTQTTLVYLKSLGAKVMEIYIYCFTHTTCFIKHHESKGSIFNKINTMLHTKYNCSMAFSDAKVGIYDDNKNNKDAHSLPAGLQNLEQPAAE